MRLRKEKHLHLLKIKWINYPRLKRRPNLNPVLSTLRYFREEYEAHVFERTCPAGVCSELKRYRIVPDKCKGCTLCAKKCPSDAIVGAVKTPHVVVPDKCIGCGTCVDVCKFDAIIVE